MPEWCFRAAWRSRNAGQYPLQERSLVVLVTRKPEEREVETVTSSEIKAVLSKARADARTIPGPSPI